MVWGVGSQHTVLCSSNRPNGRMESERGSGKGIAEMPNRIFYFSLILCAGEIIRWEEERGPWLSKTGNGHSEVHCKANTSWWFG
jgi:hypothetical protein